MQEGGWGRGEGRREDRKLALEVEGWELGKGRNLWRARWKCAYDSWGREKGKIGREGGKKGRKGGKVGKGERGKEMVERGEEMGMMEGREKGIGCRGGKGRKEGLECWKREWKEEIRWKAGRNGNDGTLSWKGRVGKEGKGEKREKVVERS